MRILFVTANRVGDAVLSTGILAHLIARHPNAQVTVAAGPAAASLFRNTPCLEQLITFEKKPYGRHWLSLWRQALTTRWDIVVDLRRSALAYGLWARNRCILPKGRHEMHRVELLASTLGLETAAPAPVLWPDDSATLMPSNNTPVIAIAPAANWVGKQWRADRFGDLALRLIAEDGPMPKAKIAVIAAAGERDQATPILEMVPNNKCIDLIGVGDLATVGGCLSACQLFVGNDSGLMHMAAAAGIPTLGLFGPSRVEHYAPWGPQGAYVRTPETYEELTTAPGYDHRTTGTLMDGLSVDTVFEATLKLLAHSKKGSK